MSDPFLDYSSLLEELALLTTRGTSRVVRTSPRNEIEEMEIVGPDNEIDMVYIHRRPKSTKVDKIVIKHSNSATDSKKTRTFTLRRTPSGELLSVDESVE